MMALLLEGVNPGEYGFKFTPQTGAIMKNYFKHAFLLQGMVLQRWLDLQTKFLADRGTLVGDKSFEWLASFDFSKANQGYIKKIRLFRSIWKRSLRAMTKKS